MIKEYKKILPILDIPYSIVIYDENQEFTNKFKDVEFSHSPEDFQGGVFNMNGIFYMAFLNNENINVGVIAHECKHLVNLVFDLIGQKLDTNNDELECYFLGYITNIVFKLLK